MNLANKDSAMSEVVGFMLVFTLLILFVTMVAVVAVPEYTKHLETEQNNAAVLTFANMQRDIGTLCLSEAAGVKKKLQMDTSKPVFLSAMSSVLHPVSKRYLEIIYGEPVIHDGQEYRKLILAYEAENTFSSNVQLTLDDRGVRLNGETITPATQTLVVDPELTLERMERLERNAVDVTIEYMYIGEFIEAGMTYYIISVRLI